MPLQRAPRKRSPPPKQRTLARENLEWYTFGLTKERDEAQRLKGWRIVTNLLSEPIPGEAITGAAKDGNLIIDRTHHTRTVQTEKNGKNALFELRDTFEGNDEMFVEFISAAYKQCSFAIPHPAAFKQLISVTQRIETWIAARRKGSDEEVSNIFMIPHFRIEIPPIQFDEDFRVEPGSVELLVSWERTLRTNTHAINVDVILQGQSPNLGWAYWLLRNAMQVTKKTPRIQFDDGALKERFHSIIGTERMITKARQAYKGLVAFQILTRSEEILDESQRKRLISHALGFSEGSQMLQMCHVWEVDGTHFESTVTEWDEESSAGEASETEATESGSSD